MTTPKRAPQIFKLIDRLVVLRDAGTPNDIELHRLYQEVKRQLPQSPGDAHMALGMIAFLKGDHETADREHRLDLVDSA